MIVPDKKAFYKLYSAGLTGNKPLSWQTLEELESSGFNGVIGIRHRVPNSKHFIPYVNPTDARRIVNSLGIDPSEFQFSAMVPDETVLLNAEYGELPFPSLYYSTVPAPMRKSLAEGAKQVYNSIARKIVRDYMDGNSFDTFEWLLTRYPTAVLEFTVFDRRVGTWDNCNTIFWEVRNY